MPMCLAGDAPVGLYPPCDQRPRCARCSRETAHRQNSTAVPTEPSCPRRAAIRLQPHPYLNLEVGSPIRGNSLPRSHDWWQGSGRRAPSLPNGTAQPPPCIVEYLERLLARCWIPELALPSSCFVYLVGLVKPKRVGPCGGRRKDSRPLFLPSTSFSLLLSLWWMCILDDSIHLIERAFIMRTNIVINDRLMRQAMKASGLRTKRETVEAGLKLLVQIQAQTVIRRLKGAVRWDGNLEESRTGRVPLASWRWSIPPCGSIISRIELHQRRSGLTGKSVGKDWDWLISFCAKYCRASLTHKNLKELAPHSNNLRFFRLVGSILQSSQPKTIKPFGGREWPFEKRSTASLPASACFTITSFCITTETTILSRNDWVFASFVYREPRAQLPLTSGLQHSSPLNLNPWNLPPFSPVPPVTLVARFYLTSTFLQASNLTPRMCLLLQP